MNISIHSEKHNQKYLFKLVFTTLFSALIGAGAFIVIPTVPLPIVIQNMLVVITGALIGPLMGAASVLIFLVAGTIGLPIFSGGRSGLAHWFGPSGGFLFGYLCAVIVTGLIIGKPSLEKKTSSIQIAFGCLIGFIVLYIPGILRLQIILDTTFSQALLKGMLPFLPGDCLKLIISIPLVIKLRTITARYIFI